MCIKYLRQTVVAGLCMQLVIAESAAQCITYTSAVSDVTLQCSGGTGSRSGVAYFPTQNRYYSVNAGSASNPIETFAFSGGAAISSTLQAANFHGFWYNGNLGMIEGNVPVTGNLVTHTVNPINLYASGTVSILANATAPAVQSCAQYDPSTDCLLYYSGQKIFRYQRSTGTLAASVAISGLPATSLNANSMAYTGIAGSEVGVYDHVSRKVYFVNYTTGAYVAACSLPGSAPVPTLYGMGFANNRVFLYDQVNSCWYGYKVTSHQDLVFYGNNILCKKQSEFISAGAQAGSTYTWNDGTHASGTVIFTPTVSGIMRLSVTDSLGCVSKTGFVYTAYADSAVITVSGPDSLHCTNLSPVVLHAAGAVTYSWHSGSNSMSVSVTPTVTSIFTSVGTNSIGCRGYDTHTVFVHGGPTLSIWNSAPVLCSPGPVTLAATGATSYTWEPGVYSGSMVVNPAASGFYTVTGANQAGCRHVKSTHIELSSVPVIKITGKSFFCQPATVTLFATGSENYTWSAGVSNGYSTTDSPSVTTTYSVWGSNSYGCVGSSSFIVTISECVGVGEATSAREALQLFPNPFSSILRVQGAKAGERFLVQLFDQTGTLVISTSLWAGDPQIDLSDLAPGIYVIWFGEKGNAGRKKIIKS